MILCIIQKSLFRPIMYVIIQERILVWLISVKELSDDMHAYTYV